MKCLTLHQPWASLIVEGVKRIETRSWPTNYRGPLAIHAGLSDKAMKDVRRGAKGYRGEDIRFENRCDRAFGWSGWGWEDTWGALPLGAVVAVADLVDCVPMVGAEYEEYGGTCLVVEGDRAWIDYPDDPLAASVVTDQLPYGDFRPGRWGDLLDNVRPVAEPVPVKGRQGLWSLPSDVEAAVLAQVSEAAP
jgi:hypothetical protein